MTNAGQTTGEAEFSATNLNELLRQLAAWRAQQQARTRLPEEVWQAAAMLARQRGISSVARTLRLDYYKLQRWCDPAAPRRSRSKRPAPSAPPRFVELKLEHALGRGAGQVFRVELADGRGARMSLELGREVAAVVALAEAFWKRLQ
jgi:hypothetical protein